MVSGLSILGNTESTEMVLAIDIFGIAASLFGLFAIGYGIRAAIKEKTQ